MSRLEATGSMVQWAIELSQFDIEYKPRTAIKAQVLADFVTEFTMTNPNPEAKYWMMYIDGSSAAGVGSVSVVAISPGEYVLRYGVRLQFLAIINEVDYEAILTSLRVARALGARNLKLNTNSKLVVGNITNEYEVKEERIKRYLKLTNQLISHFDDVWINQVPREENSEADKLAKLASSNDYRERLKLSMKE